MALTIEILNDPPQHRHRKTPSMPPRFSLCVSVASRLIITVLILALHTPVAIAQPSPSRKALTALQDVLGSQRSDFTNYQSEHFLLAADADQATATVTLHELEDTYQHVRRWADSLHLSVIDAHESWPVVYFAHQKDYQLACEHMGVSAVFGPGLYVPVQHVAIFQDIANLEPWQAVNQHIAQLQLAIRTKSDQSDRGNGDQLRRMRDQLQSLQKKKKDVHRLYQQLVIRHEAAHMIINGLHILNPGVSQPDWLSEGLACQFEIPYSKNESLGSNSLRMGDLKNALVSDEQPGLAELLAFVSETTFTAQSSRDSSWAYAQAWALVYYLQNHHPTQFTTYLVCQAAPAPGSTNDQTATCFQTTFLDTQSTFKSNWKTWLSDLKLDR